MIGQGAMEPTNEWYGTAKFLGMKLCESYQRQYGLNYFSVVPTNTFGPGDSLKESEGHVISDLLLKSLRLTRGNSGSKILRLWGTGAPIREFLYVDDLADAIIFLHDTYQERTAINIGGGEVLSILDLAARIVREVDDSIGLEFDDTQPNGAPARFLDNRALLSMGWTPSMGFDEGLRRTVDWYRKQRVFE
jgi:GDP-L-fucose synthase